MNARNIIGFDTPSKAKAQAELSSKSQYNSPLGDGADSERVKAETMNRLQQIGEVICGNDFQNIPPQQRQQLLMDFAYFSKVADTIM